MSLETTEATTLNRLAIAEKFMFALGNVKEWEYTGECNDAGPRSMAQCICGHHIRFIFTLHNTRTGATAHVGSECINHFQEYSPELYATLCKALEELRARIKAEKKAQKEAEEAAALSEAGQKWAETRFKARRVVQLVKESNSRSSWLPTEAYYLQCYANQDKAYKSTRGRIKWLQQQTDLMLSQVAKVCEARPSLAEPIHVIMNFSEVK